jgi:GrpB-like predicted nucleotidyltransferase (UPF0157 family)
MSERFTVQDRGKPYLVELERGDAVGERWIVTLGGTAITALGRERGETRADVARRLRDWLAAHPGMHSRDDRHLGGG